MLLCEEHRQPIHNARREHPAKLRRRVPLLRTNSLMSDPYLTSLQEALPRTGAIECRYEHPSSVFPVMLLGYDFKSGAFYKVQNGAVFMRTPEGAYYEGRDSGLLQPIDPDSRPSDAAIDRFIPSIILRQIVTEPELVQHVAHDAPSPGLTTMVVLYPWGSREYSRTGPPPIEGAQFLDIEWTYVLDDQFRIVSASTREPEFFRSYDYAPDSPPGIPLVRSGELGWTLKSFTHLTASDNSAAFAPQNVQRVALEAQTGLAVQSPVPQENADGLTAASEIAGSTPQHDRGGSNSPNIGLLVGGVLVTTIGVVLWVRRRMAR